MKKCDDCKGKGEIELFTSWAECEKCGGTGQIVEESDDDKEGSWCHPAARQIGKTTMFGDWATKPFGARHPFGGVRPAYIKEPAHKIEDMQVGESNDMSDEEETSIPLMAGDQKIGEITNVRTTTNEPCMMGVSLTIDIDKVQHKLLEDVADIEEVSLRVNDNKDAFPVIQGHRHVGKNSSFGSRVRDECVICQKKGCKHLAFRELNDSDV